jgi:prepilin-type processing-associated H-X9-DG protein
VSTYDFFPSAGWGMMWMGDADRGTGPSQPGSWIYQILPFLGLDMIHDLGKGQGNGGDSSSYKYTTAGPEMKSAVVPLFICPTRRRAVLFPDLIKQGAYNAALPTGLTHSDYCANTGTWDAGEAFGGPPTSCLTTFPNCAWDSDASNGDGVVYQASQVTPGSISDGLSNTFFAGEKSLDPPYYYTSAEAGDDNSMLEGFDHDIVRWCSQNMPPVRDMISEGCTTNGTSFWCPHDNSFGSAHAAGVNFVYCDGSVRLITYSINLAIYQNLGCRNDGQNNDNY